MTWRVATKLWHMFHPKIIRVEAATACQLRCPLCETTRGKVHPFLGRGFLSAADFSALLDANPWVRHVELSNWGEIFLNPELAAIVEVAHRRGVTLSADNGTNFNRVAPGVLAALVEFKFHSLNISLDGATQAVYEKYRVGGQLDRALENVRELNRLKAKAKSEFPRLNWQFIVFGHNEHEIDSARALAAELGMTFRLKLASDDSQTFSPVKNLEALRSQLPGGVATRQEYYEKHGERYLGHAICRQLWDSPQLNYDGKVLGCCVNSWADFGNAFSDGLENVLNGKKMNYARRMLQGKARPRRGIPCTGCSYYKTMRRDRNWMKMDRPPLLQRVWRKLRTKLAPNAGSDARR